MESYRLVYKNFFGEFNILITKTSNRDNSNRNTIISSIEIYNAHIWINDNVVKKNHIGQEFFILDSFISDDELENSFKFDILKLQRKLKLNKINEDKDQS
jgi:hypothetical protein